MVTQTNRTYHRLSLRTYENADETEGWQLYDRGSKRIVFKGYGEMVGVIRRFLANERMEALLCSEIDREFGPAASIE